MAKSTKDTPSLAPLPDTSLIDSLSEKQAAERIGLSRATLAAHRKNGTGPSWFVTPGGFHIRYRVADILAWIQTLTAHPEKFRKARAYPGRPKEPDIPFEQTPIGEAIAQAEGSLQIPDTEPTFPLAAGNPMGHALSELDRADLEEALMAEQPGPVATGSPINPAELDHD